WTCWRRRIGRPGRGAARPVRRDTGRPECRDHAARGPLLGRVTAPGSDRGRRGGRACTTRRTAPLRRQRTRARSRVTATPKRLEGKLALVTGSSKGIGRGLAPGLARYGAAVAVNYKNDRQGAEATARAITDDGGTAVVLGADISRSDEARRLVEDCIDQLG